MDESNKWYSSHQRTFQLPAAYMLKLFSFWLFSAWLRASVVKVPPQIECKRKKAKTSAWHLARKKTLQLVLGSGTAVTWRVSRRLANQFDSTTLGYLRGFCAEGMWCGLICLFAVELFHDQATGPRLPAAANFCLLRTKRCKGNTQPPRAGAAMPCVHGGAVHCASRA